MDLSHHHTDILYTCALTYLTKPLFLGYLDCSELFTINNTVLDTVIYIYIYHYFNSTDFE